ncbi:hypothetical protein CIRG_03600 [Coccidioides immitis RMSCC 2394]|uniref:Uncharacterized protein n=1 Tax=Coccidioides immitis RMSCC 2394 TaxID=404692 RepID=A0A0J6YAT7_COCIT|nr:hypothetical protein CIRG_03600 [Coccidioides immitis RMSCC 2394]
MIARSGDSLQNNYPAEINELRGSSGPTRLENADMDASRSPYYELRCSSTTGARLDALTQTNGGAFSATRLRNSYPCPVSPLHYWPQRARRFKAERRPFQATENVISAKRRSSPRERARAPPPPKLKPGRWFGERRSGGCARSLKSQPSPVPQEKTPDQPDQPIRLSISTTVGCGKARIPIRPVWSIVIALRSMSVQMIF